MASENGAPAEQKCCEAIAEQEQKEAMLRSLLKSAFYYGRKSDVSFNDWLLFSGANMRGLPK